ncbi:MAG: 50S ribosomal protein L24 [Pseudomonadales bacterium]|nr:50S ribosomal protein L24 [Candidatus Woesebacteria bacterium]MCB9801716.1 50S ribosomal protein L24 [Pseudomonadales bacterium]
MKLRVGDNVIVTAGKDKGVKSEITRVIPKSNKVVVRGVNMYVKHTKPMMGRSGERTRTERPLSTAKVAILNQEGAPDRVGYVVDKKGVKQRIFKKTGNAVDAASTPKKSAAAATAKKTTAKAKKSTKKSAKKK